MAGKKLFRFPDKEVDKIMFMVSVLSNDSAECALCREEKRGQAIMTSGNLLPKKARGLSEQEVKQKYESFGIKVLDEDEYHFLVELKPTMEIKPEENVFWSSFYDGGKLLAKIFYKKDFMFVDAKIYFEE